MKQTAAIYARVSLERQKEEHTIGSQTALLQEYAQAHNYCVPAQWIFEDEGYSGGSRTSTKTTRRQAQYYRCLGSDRYRHLRGPVCSCRPIRQEYLDELVWSEIGRLLNGPALVRAEIERRVQESLSSDPAQQRKARLGQELKRIDAQLDKLLDAYQEESLSLAQLRQRVPDLRRRQAALDSELQGAALQAMEETLNTLPTSETSQLKSA
jgi:hypothetical protein